MSRADFYPPVYSLRRICAHGKFENIVTEVGQIRRTVTHVSTQNKVTACHNYL